MNFTAAAHEVLNWTGSHPVSDAIFVALGVVSALAVTGSIIEHKKNKEDRRAVKEISARGPNPGRTVIAKDRALEHYDADGQLKYRIPFETPKL